jgi:hypothetical protein
MAIVDPQDLDNEFAESWRWTEDFYREDPDGSTEKDLLRLLSGLRALGYDRVLRAGHSMFILTFSRAGEHGLRSGQPSVAVERLRDGAMKLTADFAGRSRTVTERTIGPSQELLRMLEMLRNEPVT